MAKCFFTGVKMYLKDTYVLNIGATNQVIKELREQLRALERLLAQLGTHDEVEEYDHYKKKKIFKRYIRLVSPEVAKTLSAVFPTKSLFLNWLEWNKKRKKFRATKHK